MAEAGAAWKRVAAANLAPAHRDCNRAWYHLRAALRDLETAPDPLQNRDGAGHYVLLDSAAYNLERASWLVTLSTTHLLGIEYLNLRGCGAVPTHPVASISDLRGGPDAYSNVCLALVRLQGARDHGQVVLHATEAASSHLWAARIIASRVPQAHGRHADMLGQVDAATRKIREVLTDMGNMAALVSFANEPPANIRWRQP